MHTNEPRELQGVELGYDPRDIDSKGIYKVVFYFFLFAVLFFGGGFLVYVNRDWGGRTSFDPRKPAFAGPKVQGNITSKVDIMTMRQHEREVMESYDKRENGTLQIPVEAAIEKLGARGLPSIASDEAAVSKGNTIEQNATGPAPSSTATSPSESAPGGDRVKNTPPASNEGAASAPAAGNGLPVTPSTPNFGGGSTGTTAGGAAGVSGP